MDLAAAVAFVATHARLLERRRLHHLLGTAATAGLSAEAAATAGRGTAPGTAAAAGRDPGSGAAVLAALDAHRNPDGGYGWALEPDLRSVTSQPVAAMHALEVLAEIPDTTSQRGPQLCDWLAEHTLADGGVPFALPYADTAGSAPHWAGADATVSSLQMTAQLAAQAHRLARHRADVAAHPWLATATASGLDAIDRLVAAPHAYELLFVLRFLDVVAEHDVRARHLLRRVAGFVRVDGPTPVAGTDGEVLYPLDFTPYPGTPARAVFDRDAIAADLRRLDGQQLPDGGWTVTFPAASPAAAMEWRGYATVQAVAVLRGAPLAGTAVD